MDQRWFHRVRELTIKLVQHASVTNSPGETTFPHALHEIVAAHPYFRAHPEHLWLESIADDPHGRSNLFALVRGQSATTVVLTGHYDVVSVANYGALQAWAFDPEALLPRLIAALEQGHPSSADRAALADLRSGAYLPGRGALDMKSGLAAGLAVLEQAALEPGAASVLFITTPDEEVNSTGMRAAVLRLPEIATRHGLNLAGAINLDAAGDRGDGRDGRAVYLGTVGKLLATVLVVGRDTHAGYPFDGINANHLAAAILRRVDSNVDLVDVAQGVAAPPPVNLQQADNKTHYDVTTPAMVWSIYNLLTHTRSAEVVLTLFRDTVREALAEAVAYLETQAARFTALLDQPTPAPHWEPHVLTFAELRQHVEHSYGREAITAIEARLAGLDLDLPQFSRRVTEELWALSGLSGPAAIVGFGSVYYPPAFLDDATPAHTRFRQIATAQAATLSAEQTWSMGVRPFFAGISDISFLAGSDSAAGFAAMSANSPGWGARFAFDYGAVQALRLPTINIGPWGNDYHQRLERVQMPYSFEVVPELIWRIVQTVADQEPRT